VIFGAKMNAEQALFANFFFNFNITLQNQSPFLNFMRHLGDNHL
jgi:hypothetical protein